MVEKMIHYLKGMNGQVEVYEDKLVIKRKGVFGWASHGFAGDRVIPISSIKTIQYKAGSLIQNGFIQFGISGSIEKGGDFKRAVHDENSIILHMGEQSNKALDIKNYIENKICELNNKNSNLAIHNNISSADEILKYKQLLDQGIINNEEFENKKKQLLNCDK